MVLYRVFSGEHHVEFNLGGMPLNWYDMIRYDIIAIFFLVLIFIVIGFVEYKFRKEVKHLNEDYKKEAERIERLYNQKK